MLASSNLDVCVAGRVLVRDLNLSTSGGQNIAMLGQNGVGKTLTLHTLAGLRAASRGEICLGGLPLKTLGRRKVARHLGLLMQVYEDPFPSTVLETVLVGRHPHIDFWQWESAADVDLARHALGLMDLQGLETRNIHTLSGGERRRLAIAAVLAQQPDVYLMDEPLNHLDPQHQLHVLRLLQELSSAGSTVLTTLHDPNAAIAYCTHALLLFGEGSWLLGSCEEVLNTANLGRLYNTRVEEINWKGRRYFALT
ncbi:MAG: ABC transporter ATP-binding protein [Gammaproteobacteria bacterium]|jgi:iron complex transport system ATP-binding protein|nr:ABC transporter ATP-binding protein [Gammaproteobacteria bacterium]